MGFLYPPTGPTLSGDVLTINRFLASPTMVLRRLRTLAEQRFVAEVLLTGRIPASGGAIAYEMSESIYSDRSPSPVAPGGEYERALAAGGVAALARVTKYGQDIRITDEAIGRQPAVTVNRSLTKLVNSCVNYVDTISLAAISAAVTQTQAAVATWNNASADPFLDVMLATAQVEDLAQGYSVDTIVLTSTLYARLVANQKVMSGLARESSNTITNTGELVRSSRGSWSGRCRRRGCPRVWVPSSATRTQLGSLGYEDIPSPSTRGQRRPTSRRGCGATATRPTRGSCAAVAPWCRSCRSRTPQ
jgi:hypothetical protein